MTTENVPSSKNNTQNLVPPPSSNHYAGDEARFQKILCRFCGWKYDFSYNTAFEPTLKVIYGAHKRGIWSIGTKHVLYERTTDDPNPYAGKAGLDFISQNTTIPIPKVVMQWEDGKKVYTLMEKIPGRSLEQLQIERSVTRDDFERYAKETAGYLDQLRSFTSDTVGWCHEKVYNEQIVAWGTSIHHGEKEEYFANWSGDEIQRKEAEDLFPDLRPFTLSHLDIHAGNIMIHDGHVAAIIDWESAGYVPVWYEYMHANTYEFGKMVAKYLKHQYPDAVTFRNRFLSKLEKLEPIGTLEQQWQARRRRIRVEERWLDFPWDEDVVIYRKDRFIESFLGGEPSDKEVPGMRKIDLDQLPPLN